MTRRWIVLTALSVIAFFAASLAISWALARPAHRPIAQPGPVIVVAMPTLTWEQISRDRTPALWSLAERGAVGNVVTRNVSPHSCSRQSWLTMSAGARADIGGGMPGQTERDGVVPRCQDADAPVVSGDSARFPDWPGWHQASLKRAIPADTGLLADQLAREGQCVAAVGPLAAYGAADRDGFVARYTPRVQDARLDACPVTLVDLGGTSDLALGRLLAKAPNNATVVITGLADDYTPEQLRTAIVAGPGVRPGLLRSSATRQPGLIQGSDLTALLLQRIAPEPALLEGRRPVVQPELDREGAIDHVRGVTVALRHEHRTVAPFFYSYVGAALALLLAGLALLRRAPRAGRRWFAAVGAWTGAVPISTFLVGLLPWWDAAMPGLALTGGILLIAAAIAALTLLGPWRNWTGGPATFLAILTVLVIAEDVTHSSRLQLISIMGLQPVYGGRFYGMGNVAYAIYASCAILATATIAGRWIARGQRALATATVIVMGVAAMIIDGHPSWGADAGGPLAMLPAFGYLAINAAGFRLTWQRMLALGSMALIFVGGLGYLDYLRPPQYRTHIGEFVASFLESGQTTALQRNVMLNWQMLTSQWINLFVPVLLALAMLALMRPASWLGRPLATVTARVPFLGHGLAAVTICWLIGFCANDSGTAIPPSGMIVIVPMVILVAAHRGRSMPGDVVPEPAAAPQAEPVRAG